MRDGDDPKTSSTIIVGMVGTILMLAVVVFAVALFYDVERAEWNRKVVNRVEHEVNTLKNEQLERLNGYRWVNEQEGVVGIPIERAIELTVADLKSGRQPHNIKELSAQEQGPQPQEMDP